MELRVLEYFLAVAREQNITAAAESLHLSQPTLSRQLKDMEKSLGKQLFIRGKRKVTLTEEGILLRKRAEEILDLVKKTEQEITLSDDSIAGDIYIGTGESEGVRLLIRAGMNLQQLYPDIHIHTVSGDAYDLMEHLDKGLFDFAVLWDPIDLSKYESMQLPYKDSICLLMQKNSPLASKEKITLTDLAGLPIITARQQDDNSIFMDALQKFDIKLNIVASYNLIYNASLMVQEGMGYAIGFDNIIDTSGNRNLITKPLYPLTELSMNLVWKKYPVFNKASSLFLQEVSKLIF
ncbi:MAG: LysR family transcriptional regulator [Clostridia bacterium]|nr:LysR family transcriptional regulator [Clostridia bacterium]NCC44733.1 LysR family transcriptional regulator [Clostridia bacterium]